MNHLLFRAVDLAAERAPEHEAVRCAGASLTYSRLARSSNALACGLRETGFGRGDRVGTFMTKGLNSAVAMHGIMKAGGVYVPLDPFAPASRIAAIVRDCGIRHLVSTDSHLELTSLLDENVDCVEWLIGTSSVRSGLRSLTWDEIASRETDTPPEMQLTEQDLAYILYTSGSTGTPKGIMHTHRSGLSFALWAADAYGLKAEDRLSNHAPLHFDLSTFDFFAAAQAGATTVIVPEPIAKLPADLGRLIERERLTVWYSVPYALIQLLERGRLSTLALESLRWMLFAGEVFPVKHLRRLMESLPHVRFSNLYGPTETNVCTYYHVPASLPDTDEPLPIGEPCENVESIVVDDNDRPVRKGEPGELLIRGGVVMHGYWGRNDLTERGFYRRPKPGGGEPDTFYRTGDLVEELPHGEFKYLGRKDRQIKTRGFRVELDEVEAALLTLDGVEEAAAFTVPDAQGSRLIEAAVTAKPGCALSGEAAINHVASRLPAYAVPVRVRVVSAFPRTSTGKIDRREIEAQAMAGPVAIAR